MTHTTAHRRAAAHLAATVALGIAAPAAGARPIDIGPAGSSLAAGSTQTQPNAPFSTSHNNDRGISDWGVIAIGSGAGSLALVGFGGTLVASRRRRQRRTGEAPTLAV